MRTNDLILKTIGISTENLLDDMQVYFDLELTESDVRSALEMTTEHLENALISVIFDKVIERVENLLPSFDRQRFNYYVNCLDSHLSVDNTEVGSWGEVIEAILPEIEEHIKSNKDEVFESVDDYEERIKSAKDRSEKEHMDFGDADPNLETELYDSLDAWLQEKGLYPDIIEISKVI